LITGWTGDDGGFSQIMKFLLKKLRASKTRQSASEIFELRALDLPQIRHVAGECMLASHRIRLFIQSSKTNHVRCILNHVVCRIRCSTGKNRAVYTSIERHWSNQTKRIGKSKSLKKSIDCVIDGIDV
jgi:hypothetical protein